MDTKRKALGRGLEELFNSESLELSNISGCWTNITDKMIEEADKEDEEAKAQQKQEEEELENAANNAIKEDGDNEVSGKPEEKKEAD